MSPEYFPGSRSDRAAAVETISNTWTLDTLLDIIGGLHDHGYQVQDAAQVRLLELACDPDIKPVSLHPRDLAFRYVIPSTHQQTTDLVRKMKKIGMPARDICEHFFSKMKGGSKDLIRESLEVLKDSPLKQIAEKEVSEYLEKKWR